MAGKVSVIIPVYNLQQYIARCLDSVTKQTYKNLEILVIDNNSSDKSLKIIQEYAEKDNRIKVFSQPVQGVSYARNLGLENVTGDYISFVDGDDSIDENMYQLLVSEITAKNTDLVVCNLYLVIGEEKNIRVNFNQKKIGKILTGDDIFNYIFSSSALLTNTLIKKEIFYNLFFRTDVAYGEDQILFLECLKRIKSAVILDKPLYYYYIEREGNVVSSKPDQRSLKFLDVSNEVIDFLLKKEYPSMAISRAVNTATETLQKFTTNDDNPLYSAHLEKIEILFKNFSLAHSIAFFKDSNYNFNKKLIYSVLKISPKLYLILDPLYKTFKK
ncbi:MAG: glycosyltransferase family 2 protein [Erysipelotrichaceae bacterium]